MRIFRVSEVLRGDQLSGMRRAFLKNLALLELFPIVGIGRAGGESLQNKKDCFNWDNLSVVTAINNISASVPPSYPAVALFSAELLVVEYFLYAVHIQNLPTN